MLRPIADFSTVRGVCGHRGRNVGRCFGNAVHAVCYGPTSRWFILLKLVLFIATMATRVVAQDVTPEAVREAIDKGVALIKKQQDLRNGTWTETSNSFGGVTALCTLALLNAGVPADDPAVARALDRMESDPNPKRTYVTSLQTMAFCQADPRKYHLKIRERALWLEHAQIKGGKTNGAWTYSDEGGGGDNSNSQFALLALHEAARVRIPVSEQVWRRALNYWIEQQKDDGGWGYNSSNPATGSMTCAGLSSMIIISQNLSKGDARAVGGQVICCGAQQPNLPVDRGLAWLARHFSVTRNPSPSMGSETWYHYYMYGLERVGRMSGQRFVGEHDWYREGAAALVAEQDPLTGRWYSNSSLSSEVVETALATLFLSKGRRPVLISKLKRPPVDDWNHHREDLANLTRYVEARWKFDMTWQVIDVDAASTQDLMQTPVLWISGRDGLMLNGEQKQRLAEYINQGGFVFAEACCDGKAFDARFRALMEELFPDNPLHLLPPDHPVWYAEQRINPDYVVPLWGIDSCCRTSVVYCPQDLGCLWDLAGGSYETYPDVLKERIKAALGIGANVMAYATNRQLRDKLDVPIVLQSEGNARPLNRGALHVAKLQHGGGSDEAPKALLNLLRVAGKQLDLDVSDQRRLLSLTDPALADFPLAFIHGRRKFEWTAAERQGLAEFIKNGGVVFGDAICASAEFAESFRQQVSLAVPGSVWQRVPPGHPMFSRRFGGYDLTTVTIRDPQLRAADDDPLKARLEKTTPVLEGIEIDGHYVALFSPWDISCSLESAAPVMCKGYIREDAAKIGINVLLYAMQD